MAKKGQTVQLQQDIVSNEDWNKFIERDGLLVVDIYSEWCGPCVAMQANLKKLKLEVGGDFLQLGMARSNYIEALKRFREKSEPAWMFIAQKQQVNLLFGCNAPALQKMILDEMKKEKDCLDGSRTRVERLPEQYSEQEQLIYEQIELAQKAKAKLVVEKAFKALKDRRIAQAKNILDSLSHVGLVLIFPHAMKKGYEIFESFLPNTGITVSKKERPLLTEEQLEEIEFLSTDKLPEASKKALYAEKSLALMLAVDTELAPGPIDDTILAFVYGRPKKPPGDPESIAFLLQKSELNRKIPEPEPSLMPQPEVLEEILGDEGEEEEMEGEHEHSRMISQAMIAKQSEDILRTLGLSTDEVEPTEEEVEEEEEEEDVVGIWAPANDLVKSTALKYFFPLITAPLILPDPEESPPHMAVAFDSFKHNDVFRIIDDYKQDVMNYGFFTSDDCEQAKLIAKTKSKYERTGFKHGEKLVLKISKKKSDAILAFAQLGPCYMSSNVEAGEYECSVFFPEGYNDEDAEEQPVSKRKVRHDEEELTPEVIVFEGVVEGEVPDEYEDIGGEVEVIPPMEMTELPEVEEEEDYEDKATSPVRTQSTLTSTKSRSKKSKLVMVEAAPEPEEIAPPPVEVEAIPPVPEAAPESSPAGDAPATGESDAPAEETQAPAEEALPVEDAPLVEEAPPMPEEVHVPVESPEEELQAQ